MCVTWSHLCCIMLEYFLAYPQMLSAAASHQKVIYLLIRLLLLLTSGKEEDGWTKLGDIMSFSLDMHQHSSKKLTPYASVPLLEWSSVDLVDMLPPRLKLSHINESVRVTECNFHFLLSCKIDIAPLFPTCPFFFFLSFCKLYWLVWATSNKSTLEFFPCTFLPLGISGRLNMSR